MSEGDQTIAEGHAVVGEPASEPHQAVVVGEPQEEAVPVLGEPVPLANGLQEERQEATPPAGADEPDVNGVQAILSHLHPHQDEAFVQDQEESLDPPRASEESPTSSESPSEVNPNASEAPAQGNPNPSDAPSEETPSPSDAPVAEAPCVPDAPADESPSAADEPNATELSADAAEVPYTADFSAESRDSVVVSPEVPIENPYLPLEEASAAQKDAPSEALTVDPVADEESLIEATLASAAPDEEGLPTQVELSHVRSGASQATQQGLPVEEAIAAPAIQGEASTEEPSSSETVLEGVPATDSKVSKAAQEEALVTEPVQISQRDTPLQDSVASDIVSVNPIDEEAKEIKSTEEVPSVEAKEIKSTEEVPSVEGTQTIEYHGVESHVRESDEAPHEGSSADLSLGVADAIPEEVFQAEGFINGDKIPWKGALHEDNTMPDSHLVQNHAEAVVLNSTTREIPAEEYTPGQSLTEETLPEGTESSQGNVPAANGVNGVQSVEDACHEAEREQDFSKDDESAEGKEKPSSRMKLPLIVTGLAIAAVGVAVASISRSH